MAAPSPSTWPGPAKSGRAAAAVVVKAAVVVAATVVAVAKAVAAADMAVVVVADAIAISPQEISGGARVNRAPPFFLEGGLQMGGFAGFVNDRV